MQGTIPLRLLRARLYLERRVAGGSHGFRPARELVRWIQRVLRRTTAGPTGPLARGSSGALPCPVPFREMVINCDGSVACGSTARAPILDTYDREGSLRLSQIWEGPGFEAMRERMLAKDPGGCEGCQLYRCPGFAPIRDEELLRPPSSPRPIRQLLIEPTAVCNLDCPTICGQSYPKALQPVSRRKVRFMPMEVFHRIVEGIDRPIEKVCFYNYGEPLLHPRFFEMCRMIRDRCPESTLMTSTNGTRLAEASVRKGLLASGLDEVIVSLDGARQESYAAYRRGGQLEPILEGMRLYREERDRAGDGPRITWRYILFAWNDSDEELAEAQRLAQAIGVDRFCLHLSDLPELASPTYLPGTSAYERIRELLFAPA